MGSQPIHVQQVQRVQMSMESGYGLERIIDPQVNQFLQFLNRRMPVDLGLEESLPVHLCVMVDDEFLQRDVVFCQPATEGSASSAKGEDREYTSSPS